MRRTLIIYQRYKYDDIQQQPPQHQCLFFPDDIAALKNRLNLSDLLKHSCRNIFRHASICNNHECWRKDTNLDIKIALLFVPIFQVLADTQIVGSDIFSAAWDVKCARTEYQWQKAISPILCQRYVGFNC